MELYKIRFDSASQVQSMVKYIEFSNVFRGQLSGKYLIFIADNVLIVEDADTGNMKIRINDIRVKVTTAFFNEAISFVPCFKYDDSDDVILFTSPNIHYHVDQGGQFCTDYYGMKHNLMECITSEETMIDVSDETIFKTCKLSSLLTESKTVIYFPDYLLQIQGREQLINLLDASVYIRNLSFFILVLTYLRRCSVSLDFEFEDQENDVKKITGPWKDAIEYVLGSSANPSYDTLFEKQFFNLSQHRELSLDDFVEQLSINFTKYQRYMNGGYQIVPRDSQKEFLKRIIRSEECFHFSEVGSGKTKVILPLLCQIFLSDNLEAHRYLARGGENKDTMVILVPEHLVPDAKAQVFRYCLNLNYKEEYRVYDDIFALLHDDVKLGAERRGFNASRANTQQKKIFVTSFNLFKKALTDPKICAKVRPHREHILLLVDEVDDFLDRDKLVFNVCSNTANSFKKSTLEHFFEVSRAVYNHQPFPASNLPVASTNVAYWQHLHMKCNAIHAEVQEKSKSINKSFGIFNPQTLRHCSSNVAHDVEGYKSLIARPYESVNRAMPGSYYSDVERTIYLTYYLLMEDIAKYDQLFQEERKFVTFEYFNAFVYPEEMRDVPEMTRTNSGLSRTASIHTLDFDDLVYGLDPLSVIVGKYPETKDGLTRFLYEIILRRMEIRDKSRSVNSIDVVFNFDAIGFTGTPFIDNYPTFSYIRTRREDEIPGMINRDKYVFTSDNMSTTDFEARFVKFQGRNHTVMVHSP